MKNSKLLTTLCALALVNGAAHGAVLYNESFDYGASNININTSTVGSWTSSSGVVKYDAGGGLSHPQMSGETGGSLWVDFNAARSASDSTFSATNSPGAEFWFTTLFEYVVPNASIPNPGSLILRTSGGSVTALGFEITQGGDVILRTAAPFLLNGAVGNINTGINVGGAGTYLMLARAIIGTNSFNNVGAPDSTIDFWFDPADASSVSALGAADLAITGSKFGRTGQNMIGLFAQPSAQGRIDEIRFATEFADLNLAAIPATVIPEPSTALLGGLGFLMLLRRRR